MKRTVHNLGIILALAVFLVANAAFSQTRNVNPRSEQTNPVQLGLKHNPMPAVKAPGATILSENFDAETFPAGWSTANPDGGTGWERIATGTYPVPGWNGGTVTSPFAGGGVAFCTWITGGTTSSDQYLITPQLALTAGLGLDFWIQKWPDAYQDSVQVLLSTTNTQPASFTNVLASYVYLPFNGENWSHHLIDLSAYAGQNVYIAFREYSSTNYYTAVMFIDQVTVADLPTTPIAYVNYNTADFGLVDVGQTLTYEGFKLLNTGIGTLTSSSVTFSNPAFTSSFDPASVAVGSDGAYDFTITYTPTATAVDECIMTIATNGGTIEIALNGQGYQMPAGMIQVGQDNYIGLGVPMDPAWPNTYSQTIYKQTDINTAGKRITKVLYHYVHNAVDPIPAYTDNIKIYMGHTSATILNNWVPITELIEVYDGTITCPGTGSSWIEIDLTFPFAYNNVDNLVVAFDENTEGSRGFDEYFIGGDAGENVTIRKRADVDIDPANPLPLINFNFIPYYPNIRMQFEDLSPEPILVIFPTAVDFGYTEINKADSAEVTFSNFGGTPLHITGITGLSAPFSTANPVITIGPGATSPPTTIYFNPTTTGNHSQTVTVTSDAASGNSQLPLLGFCYPDPTINQFPYFMGFEGNDHVFPAYGWSNETSVTQANGNGLPLPWQQGFTSYSGAFSAGVANYYLLDHVEAVMTTPLVDLPASHRITFQWADNNNTFQENKKAPLLEGVDSTFFEASLDHGLTWETLAYLSAPSPEQWHKQWIDLGAFVSDSLLLRWRDVVYNPDYYITRGVALDDIVIEYNNPIPQIVLNETSWSAGLVLPNTTKESGLKYTIQNVEGGILTVTSLSGLTGTDFGTTFNPANVSLALGEKYTFGFSYSPATVGADNAVFQIATNGGTVSVALSGEAVTVGDFTSESFDGETFPPLGWFSVDADGDSYDWMRQADPSTYAYSTHTGIGCAYSESFSLAAGGPLFPDNWLISTKFTVSNLKNELAWWVSPHGDPGMLNDHYSVSISAGGTNPADFTELYMEDILTQGWNLKTLSLNAFMGQESRIAIRHYWSYNKWQVKLDDIAVVPEGTVSIDEANPANNLNIYPNPARDIININSSETIKKVSVYNTLGVLIETMNINATNCKLNCSRYAEGLYIIKLETAGGFINRRINVVK